MNNYIDGESMETKIGDSDAMWADLDAHGADSAIVENPEPAKKRVNPFTQAVKWGDDIPLADTLAGIRGGKSGKTAGQKRADTRHIGHLSEGRAKTTLKRMGFTEIERCTTGFGGRFSTKKAEADFKGWWKKDEPGEKRMLCEVKHTEKPKLGLPALREHQMKNLSAYAKRGEIALLIWTYEKEKLVMLWGENGIDGFVKGNPLTIERARELSIVGGQPRLWSEK